MRSKMYKFFLWLKDHFLLLIEVLIRLRVGTVEKEKPQIGSNPEQEDAQNGERAEL